MATIKTFEELDVWKMARVLGIKIFELTTQNNFQNDFDLIRKMRRASAIVMENIAVGFGLSSRFEFAYSIRIAKGEAAEIQSQLYRSKGRKYISVKTRKTCHDEAELLQGKLAAFISSLN